MLYLEHHVARRSQQGFSLLELSIVFVIIGAIVGALIVPIAQQQQAAQIKTVNNQLEDIKEALLNYYKIYKRLPCPAFVDSNGYEEKVRTTSGTCTGGTRHGFVPYQTIGIKGATNEDGLLVDVWGSAYRYSITLASSSSTTNPSCFTLSPGWVFFNHGYVDKYQQLCDEYKRPELDLRWSNGFTFAVVAIYSLGANWQDSPSSTNNPNEYRNYGTTIVTGDTGQTYNLQVNTDKFLHIFADNPEYDDQFIWITDSELHTATLRY